jgi:hypothetical protein
MSNTSPYSSFGTTILGTGSSLKMNITSTLFEAYLKCPTKCFLQFCRESSAENAYAEWLESRREAYRTKVILRLAPRLAPNCDYVSSGLDPLWQLRDDVLETDV